MKYPSFKTSTFIMMIAIIILLYLINDAYMRYKADYFMKQLSLTELKHGSQLHEYMTLMLYFAPKKDYYYKDYTGTILIRRYGFDRDKNTYLKAKKILNQAQKQNPQDPYILLHIVGLELLSKDLGHVKEIDEYTKKAARMLHRIDKYNPIGNTFYERIYPKEINK